VLKFKAKAVLCTDPHVTEETDPTLIPLEDVIAKSDILIVATPHAEYRGLVIEKPVADVWNLLGNGVVV
jgi:UDP-N-acetyl-D-mannosaminuronic acid dehydrogenase